MTIKTAIKRMLSLIPKSFFNFFIGLTNKKHYEEPGNDLLLDSYSKDLGKTCIKSKRSIIKNLYDLQIIVPCYNIESYGERCINSILNQKTSFSYLVVFVDDGSIDGTAELLKKYKKDNVLIISKDNGGLSSARNIGLENIYSNYLMFIDSDDYLLNDTALDSMIKVLKSIDGNNKKTIIQFGYINSKQKNKKKRAYKLKKCAPIELTGFAWGKIYSSSLFEEVGFPENYWFEDTVMHTIVFPLADQCYKSSLCTYFYRLNDSGITALSVKSPKALDTFYVTKSLLKDFDSLGLLKNYYYFYRFYMQTICNCVRVLNLPEEVRLKVFYETSKLLKEHDIQKLRQFKALYSSFKKKNFGTYEKFCKYYSALYLNLD